MNKNFRRVASLCLACAMVLPIASTAVSPSDYGDYRENVKLSGINTTNASVTSKLDTVAFTDVTGNVNITSVIMDNLSERVMTDDGTSAKNVEATVIVSLNKGGLVDYAPENLTVSEYLATEAGSRKKAEIRKQQDAMLQQIKAEGIKFEVVDYFDTVVNAVAIKVNTAHLATIKHLGSVASTVVSESYSVPKTVSEFYTTGGNSAQINPSNVYSTGIYDTSEINEKYDGSGMTVAVLDTGLDYTHEAFSVNPTELGLTYEQVKENMSMYSATEKSAGRGVTLTVDDLYLSDKVPFAYDYADDDADVYPSYSQHGVHVAGIVAGQADSYTNKDGEIAVDENGDVISFRGSAPNAQLVICKVFTDDLDDEDIGGATTEDIVAALEDCVTLNVDVINMSLGTSCGFSTIYIEGDSEGALLNQIYSSIEARGISLMCAASNDYSSGFGGNYGTNLRTNPDSGTVGSPSTFDGAMSVASINGLTSPYMLANGGDAVFYEESSDANGVKNDFAGEMLENGVTTQKFKYVVIPGYGNSVDYTPTIKKKLSDKAEGEKVIAVVSRGDTTFKEKVEMAQLNGADAIIIYNNVAGTVRMNLGELDEHIPAVSVSIDAGAALTGGAKANVGEIEINLAYSAGPFMNDYSSWGATPDLKLKPDVTAHGGEITSAVAGGYDEMSGTSMATPNLAGLTALVRQYVQEKFPEYSAVEVNRFTNQLLMSTAETVYNEVGLPYSPRKQGSGLATIDNIFTTNAYLYTVEEQGGAEDDRPKLELGDGTDGVYDITFYVKNFGDQSLEFSLNSTFFTETLAIGGLAVAEKAYMLDGSPKWQVNDSEKQEGDVITVNAGSVSKINVVLTLSNKDITYINKSFPNGMFVEGFIKLKSTNEEQCDLTLPYMGFYGDWESAPMLDLDIFELAEIEKDTSKNENEKQKESVWATQAYAMYYNNKYVVPMGSFAYLQDENADQIYTNKDYASISYYNDPGSDYVSTADDYMTTTGIKALYAGLLRNAEVVAFDVYDEYTGELIKSSADYRVNKAYAAGGSGVPANVLLEYTPADLGLIANGKYRMDFRFYFKADDYFDDQSREAPEIDPENTFSMTFYVDYDAPVMVDSRIRYYDYKENNKDKQRIYLDIDVYDNHYPQAIMLCVSEQDKHGDTVLKLATDYVTPIYNPKKNSTNTVSLEITSLYENYENYRNRIYIQVDDYALNHTIYKIDFISANNSVLPDDFEIPVGGDVTVDKNGNKCMTIEVNEAKRIPLTFEGSASPSNFEWTAGNQRTVKVKNGEIFGVKVGTQRVTVTNRKGKSETITVTVVDGSKKLQMPTLLFGMIENATDGLSPATNSMVEVSAGKTFKLNLSTDPWYYPIENLRIKWSSTNEKIATVDQDGNVTTANEDGIAIISAIILREDGSASSYGVSVTLDVQDPFYVSNMTLTRYSGSEKTVVIPDDKNIMTIGEDAFKDNQTMEEVIIPKTVTTIDEKAFINCSNLKRVYFISKEAQPIANSDLSMILRYSFYGCSSLELIDLSNVKVITVDMYAFTDCKSLKEIKNMGAIGKMDDYAFAGTALEEADLTGLHTAGYGVLYGCTNLKEVKIAETTVLGESMFMGCTALNSVTINCPVIPDQAFFGCTALEEVNFAPAKSSKQAGFTIGNGAFLSCISLTDVNFNDNSVKSIGDGAFEGCEKLTTFYLPEGNTVMGNDVFRNSPTTVIYPTGSYESADDGIYSGTVLVSAPKTLTEGFKIREGTTEIADYAFDGSSVDGLSVLTVPASVTRLGKGAFYGLNVDKIVLGSGVTEIPDNAFMASGISTFTVTGNIQSIGKNAFAQCSSLFEIVFDGAESLTVIGSQAFSGTALESVVLPDGVTTLGDRVFSECASLKTVKLSSVSNLGSHTFRGTPKLTSVEFGENATTTGKYTFATAGGFVNNQSVLKSVVFGSKTTTLGEYLFYGNDSIETVDLGNITEIGDGAFLNCVSLSSVIGIENVESIGVASFRGCNSLEALDLSRVKSIGHSAFAITSGGKGLKSVNMPVVEEIAPYAFYGTFVSTVYLPESLISFGEHAFGNCVNLTAYEVDHDSLNFFTANGVLYRFISQNSYFPIELIAYPSAKLGATEYAILEGTVSVKGYAFSEIKAGALSKVIIPYSVKTIGDGAFYKSGIKEYRFEAINAPTLLTDVKSTVYVDSFYSLSNNNFEDSVIMYSTGIIEGSSISPLKIYYPSNGIGYDNYMYSTFFGTKVQLEAMMEDNVRSLKAEIESFDTPEAVRAWTALEVNEQNTAMVLQFSERVKNAHATYNSIKDQTQLGFLGEQNVEKLFAIESELKAVKARFGIKVTVKSVSISPDSTYKVNYVEGEKFDMTGLKLVIEYDDYSTELADMGKVTLDSDYENGLSVYDRYVEVKMTGYAKKIRITVNVSEKNADDGQPDQPPQDGEQDLDEQSGCACASVGYDDFIGGMGLMILLAGIMVLGNKKVIKAKKD